MHGHKRATTEMITSTEKMTLAAIAALTLFLLVFARDIYSIYAGGTGFMIRLDLKDAVGEL